MKRHSTATRLTAAALALTFVPAVPLVRAEDVKPAAPAPAAAPPRVRRLMVLDFGANGVDPKVAAEVTGLVASALSQDERYSVADSGDIRTMLRAAEEKQLLGCDSDACTKGVAEAMGADAVVRGSVGRLGDTIVLRATHLDVASGTIVGKTDETAKRPDELIGRVDRVAYGLLPPRDGSSARAAPPPEFLSTREACVWAAVQYDRERKSKMKRQKRTYRAAFGSEKFLFDEYDALGEFLPLKPDVAFVGRYPSCLPKDTTIEDAFSIKEDKPLVLKVNAETAYQLNQLRRRRKLVLELEFEIEGARVYPLKEYDWRACEDDTQPFRPSDVSPNAWIRVRRAVLRDMFSGRRYALTRQEWDPGSGKVTLASLPDLEALPNEELPVAPD